MCVVLREIKVKAQKARHSSYNSKQHIFSIALGLINLMVSKEAWQ